MSLQDLDPVEDLLARLRLDHEARRRGVAIVEGPTDERVLSKALTLDRRRLFPVGGRVNLLRCAGSLEVERMSGIVCVADRDFDDADERWEKSTTVVFYDGADLEAMIVESEALDRLLEEWASKGKLERVGGANGVRKLLNEKTRPLAILRAANGRDSLGLPFDDLPMMDLFEKSRGDLKMGSMIDRLSHGGVSRDELKECLSGEEPLCRDTHRPLRRGRDLMALLAIMLRRMIGSLSQQQVRHDFVARTMRLALAPGDFENMPFDARLRDALEFAQSDN
jgi:hypothetical protein